MIPLRRIVRACIPVGLVELYRRHVPYERIWDGIYASFDDVHVRGEGFGESAWPRDARTSLTPLLAGHEHQGRIPSDSAHRTFLSVALLLAKLRGSLRVLDFGGGLAEPYVFLINSLQDASKVDYRVIDLPNVCEEGRRVFRNYPGIQFQQDLPPVTFARTSCTRAELYNSRDNTGKLFRASETIMLHSSYSLNCPPGACQHLSARKQTFRDKRLYGFSTLRRSSISCPAWLRNTRSFWMHSLRRNKT